MATMNESVFNTPRAKLLMKKYGNRLNLAESVRKEKGQVMDFERKLATAQCLENTARQLKVMESLDFAGATQPASIGQYKRYAMDMVTTVVSNLIAYDCVSVQPLENRVGMINFLQFAYGSDKGTAHRGQVFADARGYQGMNPEYTSSMVGGEDLETSNPTLKYTPVIRGSVVIVDGEQTYHDDGAGVIGSGTIDYATGKISGLSLTAPIASYEYDNETVPVQAPQMQMKIESLPITTKARKLAAIWSFDAAYELEKEYGSSMQDLMATQATAEIAQEIDNEITLDLYHIASAGPEVVWSKVQPVGVSAVDHYDSFWNKVVEGSNQIFEATRRVHANFMICGLGVDAVLKCMRNFDSANDTTSVGPHFVGTLGGMIRCYVNPNYDANTFVLGYKGPNMLDTGYVYCPYMPVTTTQIVTLEDFASRQGWATMYGKKAVNPRLYVKGRIVG